MKNFDRITSDPDILGGQPIIRGMRIPVSTIVGLVGRNATHEEIFEGYPELEEEDIQQALRYAAYRLQSEAIPASA